MCNSISFDKKGFTYFTGYKDGKKPGSICIMLPKRSAYRRDFDETKFVFFDNQWRIAREKYNELWNKVSKVIKKGFDSEPVYKAKYLKTKIKSYENFHDEKCWKKVLNTFAYLQFSLILFFE